MNALESRPNDFKLITPSKYIVQRLSRVKHLWVKLPIRIPSIPEDVVVMDACCWCLLLLVLLKGSGSWAAPMSGWIILFVPISVEQDSALFLFEAGRNATGLTMFTELWNIIVELSHQYHQAIGCPTVFIILSELDKLRKIRNWSARCLISYWS